MFLRDKHSWFYPTENLFFSLCLPKGKETELSGFFVYCSQILVWLPPLVFTLLVNADIDQKWGLMSIVVFFFIAIGILMMVAPWEEVLKESEKNVDLHFYEDADDDDDDDDDDDKQEKNESELEVEA
jgi:undecaprenyl pyrophosphate phosphatase UppP